jgi:methionyl aminopeptidase
VHLCQPCGLPRHSVQKEILKDGDIVNVDVALIQDGWFGDTSRMYYVGQPSPGRRLVDTTYEAMVAGIRAVKPGATLGDATPSRPWPSASAFPIVREYCGHGIGQTYHDEPQVLHYGSPARAMLQEGMIFTIEPMLNAGKPATKSWTTAGPWSPATVPCPPSGSTWWP